jgi:glyoxylase-like metal-dependent hydrolase (beta-lactamase superfamily II)
MRLAPGLHRVGNGLVNSYLVDDGGQVTVVDAGMPGQYGDLVRELGTMGRSMSDVRAVVLTHGDTDHIGFAERLRRDHGVPVFVHALDADRARLVVRKPSTGWGPIRVRPFASFMLYGARKGGLRNAPVTELRTFAADGTTLDVPGAPRLIHLPGHTPGSVAIHVPTLEALFVGDALTTHDVLTGADGPRLAPFTIDREAALQSLARLDGIEARWVLPGHGQAWTGGVDAALRLARAATGDRRQA